MEAQVGWGLETKLNHTGRRGAPSSMEVNAYWGFPCENCYFKSVYNLSTYAYTKYILCKIYAYSLFNVYSALFSKEGVLIWRIKDICGSDITESPKSSISQKQLWTFWIERFLTVGGVPLHCRLFRCQLHLFFKSDNQKAPDFVRYIPRGQRHCS